MSSSLGQRVAALRNSIRNSELLIAAAEGDLQNIDLLIREKADVNFTDVGGNTALHYAVEGSNLDVVHFLLERMDNTNVENNDDDTPLDVAWRRPNNNHVIETLGKKIVKDAFQLLKSSFISSRTVDHADSSEDSVQEKTELETEIEKTEKKIESCLDNFSELCDQIYSKQLRYKHENGSNSDEISSEQFGCNQENGNNSENINFKQANAFICFVETFAFQGSCNVKTKNQLKQYFAFYWTDRDRRIISKARTVLLKKATEKITLNDIQRFKKDQIDVKSFFNMLRTYVKKVYEMLSSTDYLKKLFLLKDRLENENDLDLREELKGLMEATNRYKMVPSENRIFSDDEISSLGGKLEQSLSRKSVLKEIQDLLNNKINQLENATKSQKESTTVKKSKKSESRKEATENKTSSSKPHQLLPISLSEFMREVGDEKGSIREGRDCVKSFLKEEFKELIKMSYGKPKDPHEVLFNFVTNLYPALEYETSLDFVELCELRNSVMHEFYKYGTKEFRKEIQHMRSILFRYYFAQEVHEVLNSMKPNAEPETIAKDLQRKLSDFKREFKSFNEKVILPVNEGEDYFGYKFSQTSYPEIDNADTETLVHDYLSFMPVTDREKGAYESIMETDGGNSQHGQSQYDEIRDAERRKIFETFLRLRRYKTCEDAYEEEKGKFRKELVQKHGVDAIHFDSVCATYIQNNQQFSQKNDHKIKEIVTAVTNLKKIKDHYKLSGQVIISLYDHLSKKQRLYESTENKTLFADVEPRILQDIQNEFPDNSTVDITIGAETVTLQTSKIISNVLKICYTEYHEFQAEFSIEEIFSDELFLDYLFRAENDAKSQSSFRIQCIIKKLIRVDFCAPYVVLLITKNNSDEVIETADFIKLIEILLKGVGTYRKYLNLLLNETDSKSLNLYHEVCKIIFEQNISIENTSLIFSNPKCLEKFLVPVTEKILQVDPSDKTETVELIKIIISLLNVTAYELYKNLNYEDSSKILDYSLNVYQQLVDGSLIEENEILFLIARYRRGRIQNYQGLITQEHSEKQMLHTKAFETFRSIRSILSGDAPSNTKAKQRDIRSDEMPIYLLALSAIACTQHILEEYKNSYKTYETLYQEIVNFALPSKSGSSSISSMDPETYSGIQKSARYHKTLAFSPECKKYLNIFYIMCSVAYGRMSHGRKQSSRKSAEECYRSALDIYKKVYYYKTKSREISRSSITRTLRHISDTSNQMAWCFSKRGTENDSDKTECFYNALYWYCFTLLRNSLVYKMQNEMYWPSHPAVAKSREYVIGSIEDIAFIHKNIGSKMSIEKRDVYYKEAQDIYRQIKELKTCTDR